MNDSAWIELAWISIGVAFVMAAVFVIWIILDERDINRQLARDREEGYIRRTKEQREC